MKKSLIVFFACILCALVSCNKDEGEGGTASVSGYIYKVVHASDDYSLSVDTVPAAKHDVFIYYGNDKAVGNDVETGPDGYFKFNYLTKGKYKVFAYSTYDSGLKEAEMREVNVSRGEDASVGIIYVHEGKAYGTSVIKGKVTVNYFLKIDGDYIRDTEGKAVDYPAGDVRVSIMRKGENVVLDDVRTSFDGTFAFQRLPKGEYTVCVYSASERMWQLYDENIQEAKTVDVTIDEIGKVYETGTIKIIEIK
ncbi:MAG: hypothetical protein E7076_07230 [Bacteroidales bacterium]|nr:hypothetical protein [Bacteroidales bacterium]